MNLKNERLVFLLGSIPSILLFITSMVIEGNKVVTEPADVYIPILGAKQNLNFYFDPIKLANFETFNTGSLMSLLFYFVLSIIPSIAFAQHLASLLPILFSYFTFWLFLGEVSKKNSYYRALFSNLYVFNSVSLNQFDGATGLMFIYAFLPLYLYYLLRFFNGNGSTLKNLLGSVFAESIATFFLTETVFHVILISIPILLLAFFGARMKLNSLYRFLTTVLFFLISLAIYLLALSYTYYPWIEAALGIRSNVSISLISNNKLFLQNNFYLAFPGISVFTEPYSPLFSYAYIYSANTIQLIVALISTLLLISSLSGFKKYPLGFFSTFFVILITIYLYVTNYLPRFAFFLFTEFKPFTIPLIGFPMDQEWWYVIIPWEIVSLYLGAVQLDHIYHIFVKFVKKHYRILTYKNKIGNLFLNREHKRLFQSVLVTIIVLSIIATSANSQLPSDFHEIDVSSPASSQNYFGNVTVPNHIPQYFQKLLNFLNLKQDSNVSRTLFFPTSPMATEWLYEDPLFVTFPSSNMIVNLLISDFLNYSLEGQNHQAAGVLSSLGIKFVVILWAENETNANPTLINQGLIGNPYVVFSSLIKSKVFTILSNNTNYTLLANLNFSFDESTSAEYVIPNNATIGENMNLSVPLSVNISLPESVNQANLLAFKNSHSNVTDWSHSGNSSLYVSGNENYGNVSFSSSYKQFVVSYSLINGSTNLIPVIPGQSYRISFEALTNNDSCGKLYVGWDNRTENLSNIGLQPIPTIILKNNSRFVYSSRFTIKDTFYIIPLIAIYNFKGSVTIIDPKISLVSYSSNKGTLLNYSKEKSPVNWLETYKELSSFYPFDILAYTPESSLSLQPSELNKIFIDYPGEKRNMSANQNSALLLPVFQCGTPSYGIVQNEPLGVKLLSEASISGKVAAQNGTYTADFVVSGNGYLTVKMNGVTLNIDIKGTQNISLNFSANNSRISFNFTNYLGVTNIYNVIVYNGRVINLLQSKTFQAKPKQTHFNVQNQADSFKLTTNLSSPELFIIPDQFIQGWTVSVTLPDSNNLMHLSVFPINGWEIGIFINYSLGKVVVLGTFNPGTIFYFTQFIQTIFLMLIPIILLFLYIYDYFLLRKMTSK